MRSRSTTAHLYALDTYTPNASIRMLLVALKT